MIRLITATAASMRLAGNAFAQPSCKLTPIGTGTVAAVRDRRTLSLAVGRTFRLKGIEITDTSRAALQRLAAGKTLRLNKPLPDRSGRLVAFAFAGDSLRSLQQVPAPAAHVGWPAVLAGLTLSPAFGIAAMRRLRTLQRRP